MRFADPRHHGRDADRETARTRNTDPHRDDSSHGSSSRCNVKLISGEIVITRLANSRSPRLRIDRKIESEVRIKSLEKSSSLLLDPVFDVLITNLSLSVQKD